MSSENKSNQTEVSFAKQDAQTETTTNGQTGPSDSLEDLLRQLHGQIKSSDWLTNNTSENLEKENPELMKAWKEAINQTDSKN